MGYPWGTQGVQNFWKFFPEFSIFFDGIWLFDVFFDRNVKELPHIAVFSMISKYLKSLFFNTDSSSILLFHSTKDVTNL